MRPSLSRMKYLLALPILTGCHFPGDMQRAALQKAVVYAPQKELVEKRARDAEHLHLIITKRREYLLRDHSLNAWTQCFTAPSLFFDTLSNDSLTDLPSEHVHYGGGGIYGHHPLYVGVVLDCSLGGEITTELAVTDNATRKNVSSPSLEDHVLRDQPLCLTEKESFHYHRHLLLFELKAEGNMGVYEVKVTFTQRAINGFEKYQEERKSIAFYLCLNK